MNDIHPFFELLDTKRAAKYLHISVYTLRRYIKLKNLPTIKVGHRYFFNKKQLDQWSLMEWMGSEQ